MRHVIDGDTLILRGGERLRLIGLDTPEMGRDDAPDSPFAVEARDAVLRMIEHGSGDVRLLAGTDDHDRYGRTLAHVYDSSDRNLAEHLLRQGLAYLSSVPPNLRFLDCYRAAEAEARHANRGLWRQPALKARELSSRSEGFRRIAGRVQSVTKRTKATSINLESGLRLRIRTQDLHRFASTLLDELPGQQVEVRGWLYRYRGKPSMRLRHPSAFVLPAQQGD